MSTAPSECVVFGKHNCCSLRTKHTWGDFRRQKLHPRRVFEDWLSHCCMEEGKGTRFRIIAKTSRVIDRFFNLPLGLMQIVQSQIHKKYRTAWWNCRHVQHHQWERNHEEANREETRSATAVAWWRGRPSEISGSVMDTRYSNDIDLGMPLSLGLGLCTMYCWLILFLRL